MAGRVRSAAIGAFSIARPARPKFSFAGGAVSDHPALARLQALCRSGAARDLMFGGALLRRTRQAAIAAIVVTRIVATGVSARGFVRLDARDASRSRASARAAGLARWRSRRSPRSRRWCAPGPWRGASALPPFRRCSAAAASGAILLTWMIGGNLIVLVLLAIRRRSVLVFDPRYRDIPFAPLDGAVRAVPGAVAFDRASSRDRARWRNGPQPRCLPCPRSISCSTRASPIGRRSGSAPACSALALHSGAGAGRARLRIRDADRERRKIDIVQHQAETGCRDRQRHQHKRGPDEIERAAAERDRAKHLMVEQDDVEIRQVPQSQVFRPAWQASATLAFSIAM